MKITGYDTTSDGQRFPRFAGPCKRCGSTNYGLSTSGPGYCGACAVGTPVEVIKLRRERDELSRKYIDALLAIQHLTDSPHYMNDMMRQRAEEFIRRFKAGEGPEE